MEGFGTSMMGSTVGLMALGKVLDLIGFEHLPCW